MKSVWDFSVRGVWGEHSLFQNDNNYGGPDCAAQYSLEFRFISALLLVSRRKNTNDLYFVRPYLSFSSSVKGSAYGTENSPRDKNSCRRKICLHQTGLRL